MNCAHGASHGAPFPSNVSGLVSRTQRFLTGALVLCTIAGAMEVANARRAWADPLVSSLQRVPVCGDQEVAPVQLKCADFATIPDIEVFRVPGQGAVDLTFDFVFSEAAVPNELGLFRVDALDGRVGNLSPAEPGYLAAALARAQTVFASGSDAFVAGRTVRVDGGDLLVFFIVHGGAAAQLEGGNYNNSS